MIIQEIRWYLRRRVKEPVKIIRVALKDIRDFRINFENDESELPHLNDLSNIVLAQQLDGVVVSSDLKLVKTCETVKVPVLISSSFAFLLKNKSIKKENINFFEKLYDNIFSDEISHSVERSQQFDPVTRIKKIQEHALGVLQNISKPIGIQVEADKDKYHLLEEENSLIELMNEIEFEFPNYLEQLEEGELVVLRLEL